MNKKNHNIAKKIQRKLAMEAGFYDGRFQTKVIADKKKKSAKYACRVSTKVLKETLTVILLFFVLFSLAFSETPKQAINITSSDGSEIALYNKSYALIIGVSDYNNGWPKLKGVLKDVAAVKTALESQGFSVVTVLNPDNNQLDKAYRDFINQYGMDPDNRLIIYFAGHGHTNRTSYGEEMGYIVPINAPNPNIDKNGFLSIAMAMQQIEVYAKQIQAKHALFLFDACFSGSLFAISRAIPENISYKTAEPVRQFITSGSAEETVPDESIFRSQLIAGLNGEADVNKDGYITGTELGEFLQEKVVNYSKGSQHPQYGKIRNPNLDKGDFVFIVPSSNSTAKKDDNIASNTVESRRLPSITNNEPARIPGLSPEKESWEDSYLTIKSIFAKVCLRTPSGNFVCAENGGGASVITDRKNVSGWETFELIPIAGKKASFKTQNGSFLSVNEKSGKLEANAKTAGNNEIFEVVELDGDKIALRTSSGRFLCAVAGGGEDVTTTSEKIDKHEVFNLIRLNHIGLKSYNGQFLTFDNSGSNTIKVSSKLLGSSESFEFIKIKKDYVALKAINGNYITVDENGAIARSPELTSSQLLKIIELPGGKIRLVANNGNYISAVGGGGFGLKASNSQAGDWETFEPIVSTPR